MGLRKRRPHLKPERSTAEYDARAAGARCDECPLNGSEPCPPEGPADAKLALVGEAPNRQEVRVRRPFIGMAGQIFNQLLAEAGIKREEVFLSNALLCFPTGGSLRDYLAELRLENKHRRKRGESEILSPLVCCKPRLIRELRKAKVVVPLGTAALESLAGKKSIQKWRGSPLRAKL